MSTKIYSARRLKRGVQLWPFVASVRVRAEKNIRAKLEFFYLQTVAEYDQAAEGVKKEWQERLKVKPEDKVSPFTVSRWVSDEFRKENINPMRSFFGMDVSMSVRENRGRFYIIPYANGMMQNVLDFLRTDRKTEEYHWQNQTDKSARCSDAAWEQRGKDWQEMLGKNDDHWWDTLVLDLLSPSNFYRLDPSYRMAKFRMAKRKKA